MVIGKWQEHHDYLILLTTRGVLIHQWIAIVAEAFTVAARNSYIVAVFWFKIVNDKLMSSGQIGNLNCATDGLKEIVTPFD